MRTETHLLFKIAARMMYVPFGYVIDLSSNWKSFCEPSRVSIA